MRPSLESLPSDDSLVEALASGDAWDLDRPPTTTIRTVLCWIGLLILVSALLFLPLAYLSNQLGIGDAYAWIPPTVVFGVWFTWLIGRPLAVLLADRKRSPEGPVQDRGVSIVVPCSNSAHKMEATVQSLLAQTARPIEIVLVENNSTDDTWAVLQRLEREHLEVRAFSVSTRRDEYAASVAVNYGVARASHDIIVRMDDDTVMEPDTVARAIPAIVSGRAVAVAVNLRVANHLASVWTRLQSLEYMLAMELERRTQVLVQSLLCASGGLSVFRRDVVLRSGGFCSLPKWVSEDMDMTLKAHRLGRVAMAPDAIGYTSVPETLRQLIRQRLRWAICGTVAVYIHREGVANRRYWHEGTIGFAGLPMRALSGLRDLFAASLPLYLAVSVRHGGLIWLGVLTGGYLVTLALQIAMISPALRCRQGLAVWWLLPLTVLVYGPLLLAVRFAGTWAGVRHIFMLRAKQEQLEHAGLFDVDGVELESPVPVPVG